MLNLPTLAAYLCKDGLISKELAYSSVQLAAQAKSSLALYLVKSGILSHTSLLNYCKNKFNLAIVDEKIEINEHHTKIIKLSLIEKFHVLPIKQTNNVLQLAMLDPSDQNALAAIAFHTNCQIEIFLIDALIFDKILTQLKFHHTKQNNSVKENSSHLDNEPIIELVDHLIKNAVQKQASDIHIEPLEEDCRIRLRCDGLLQQTANIPYPLAHNVITRLKVMANLNIAEKRLPQDGRISFQHHNHLDIRINTCPTLFGEKIVLRILNKTLHYPDFTDLGLNPDQKQLLIEKLKMPQGLILVTGPTGSGKTASLYACLQYLNSIEKNISSVEDPVEITLAGINQVNVNPKIGLDFANTLKAFLRQDPDIIMIGEIRDAETANIAMQAAQTGHLVLSTLHTNSAHETMQRLKSMQVDTYHLENSLSLIISQRLVRKLCSYCKIKTNILIKNQMQEVYQAQGCEHCYQGYAGRIGVFELLTTPFHKNNYLSLEQAGLLKVIEGHTSYTELIRVLG